MKTSSQSVGSRPPFDRLELEIDTRDGVSKLHSDVFGLPAKAVRNGRMTTVTEQIGPRSSSRIVRIDSGATHTPTEPGDRAFVRLAGALVQGGIVTTVVTTLLVYFYHWAFIAVFFVGALITMLVAYLRWKASSTRRNVPAQELANLEREQWLLTQLQRYRDHTAALTGRVKDLERRLAEMRKLAEDIRGARGDYQHRAEVVERGVASLEAQLEHEHRLADAIAQAEEMVIIEYRTSRALEYLPDDAIGRVTSTLATLDELNAERVELETQLEANAEVQALAPAAM